MQRSSDFLRTLKVLSIALSSIIFSYSVGYLYGGIEDPFGLAAHRWVDLAADNEFSHWVAQKIWKHDFSTADNIIVSIRGPLQPAIITLLYPIIYTKIDFLLIGMILQCFSLLALYLFLKVFSFSNYISIAVIAFTALSGFYLMNSFFVWPKLLAAAFVFAAAASLQEKNPSYFRAGAYLGLGIMAHGGAMLATLPLLFITLLRKGSWKKLLLQTGPFLMVYILPWILFAKIYELPTNHMPKWHFAGITKSDSRGFLKTLVDSYSSLPISKIIENKLINFKAQIGLATIPYFKATDPIKSWWELQFTTLFYIASPIVVLILLYPLLYKRYKNIEPSKMIYIFTLFALVIVANCIIMFGPALDSNHENGIAILHQQSYVTPLLILSLSALILCSSASIIKYAGFIGFLFYSCFSYWLPPINLKLPVTTHNPIVLPYVLAFLTFTYLTATILVNRKEN